MNWNLWKRWKQRREQRRKLKELQTMVGGLTTLDKMEAKGLLVWDVKSRRLFIDADLAYVMMRKAEAWVNFVKNVYLWRYAKECQQAWADFFLKEELAAVRAYRKAHCKDGRQLSRQEVERIRQMRRREIVMADMEPPKVEGFEFFVVHATKEEPAGELVAVGHYDPNTETLELATWQEVSLRLQAQE